MVKIITVLFTFFISHTAFAIDFSGSYSGVRCSGKAECVDGDFGKGILGTFKIKINIPAFKSDKRTVLYVDHNLNQNTVSIFFSDFDYAFQDMPLDGDQFEGNDDKSGNTSISGSFLDDTVTLTFKRYAGQDNERVFHYKAKLTATEISRRENIETLEDRDNEIDKLNDTVSNKNSKIKSLENDISKNKKEIKKLKSDLNDKERELANTIIEKDSEIDDLINNYDDQITSIKNKNNKEIASLKKENKEKIANINAERDDEINQLKKQKKITEDNLTGTIEDLLAEPLSIDPKFLTMRSKTNDECNLYTSPSDQAKVITPLNVGTEVENLAVLIDNDDWSLVATGQISDGQEGLLGYLLTDCLNDLGGDVVSGGDGSDNESDEKISISFPKWDKGKKGSRITIDAPGFISIKGKVNMDTGITEIQLNGEPVGHDSNGNFEAFFISRTGENEMTIKVIDNNNDVHELNFVIATK